MDWPEIAIVILNWNQAQETLQCLSSVRSLVYPSYRVLVIDNGSWDGSGKRIVQECPWIELIRNERNVGFAEGCNVGIRKILERPTPYLLFLNNDSRIDPSCLTYLVEAMGKDSGVGIFGAVNYLPEMPEVPSTCGHQFTWWNGRLKGLLPPKTLSSLLFEVQSISGSCFLVRREVFEKVGLFDPRFFIYYEETDLCLKAARAGFKVMVHRDAKVWHQGGHTFGRKTPAEYYLFTRNHALCLMRHCPKIFLPSAWVIYLVKVFFRYLLLIGRGRFQEASAVKTGLWDYGTGRFGEGRLATFSPKRFGAVDA